ncbi:hypothetical protein BD309DRAFT_737718 [Dichomitus squalens]|nr:hypothetical protein BD309DRAFT_737718 [Dichomitus squalens]
MPAGAVSEEAGPLNAASAQNPYTLLCRCRSCPVIIRGGQSARFWSDSGGRFWRQFCRQNRDFRRIAQNRRSSSGGASASGIAILLLAILQRLPSSHLSPCL